MPPKANRPLEDGTRQQIRLWEEDVSNVNLISAHIKEKLGVDDFSASVRYALREVANRLREEQKIADEMPKE